MVRARKTLLSMYLDESDGRAKGSKKTGRRARRTELICRARTSKK